MFPYDRETLGDNHIASGTHFNGKEIRIIICRHKDLNDTRKLDFNYLIYLVKWNYSVLFYIF